MKLKDLCCLSLAGLVFACQGNTGGQGNSEQQGATEEKSRPHSGFSLENHGTFQLLKIRDPWQGARDVSITYVLHPQAGTIPDSLHKLPAIRIPVRRVICMSTTHVAMIEALGETSSIVGISGREYISNPKIRDGLSAGRIYDVGADQSLNLERILLLKPDVVVMYSISREVDQVRKRLGRQGIPVLLNADYLESTPLGKARWLRCMAALYSKERLADSILLRIENEYAALSTLAREAAGKPVVMTGLPWKDVWYIPGNQSFAAEFIRDAGADYLWGDLKVREALPMDIEAVFHRAAGADIWINTGAARGLDDITDTDSRLENLPPFRKGQVYNNTGRINSMGGNEFWETGVLEPQKILADLIRIFHPDLLPAHQLQYYEKLK